MQRNFFSMNKCSAIEKRLLRALRTLNWEGSWPTQATFLLEELGLHSAHAFPFAKLIETILIAEPEFNLLGPNSPYISMDELTLLTALGHATRVMPAQSITFSPLMAADIQELIVLCGQELNQAKINIKPRAVIQTVKDFLAKTINDQTSETPVYLQTHVISVQLLTPNVQRIILTGKDLTQLRVEYPAQWLKVFLPETVENSIGRAYTIRHFNPKTLELTFEIALHTKGLISKWAAKAKIDDVLFIANPRGGFKPLTKDTWLLLLTDETGLSATASILEKLPAKTKVFAFIEVKDEQEQQQFNSKADVTYHWLFRNSQKERLTTILQSSILPEHNGFAWITGEASTVRELRLQLLNKPGFDFSNIQPGSYWKLGQQNHKELSVV